MKIRKLTPQTYAKASALLVHAFSPSTLEAQCFEQLHKNGRPLHQWVCLHRDTVIAYIGFSNAYYGKQVCGLHLAPLAVKPQMQGQGIGTELMRFALRQDVIKATTLFVFGNPKFYKKFGFERCSNPVCPFDRNNAHFLSMRHNSPADYIVGYEPEFQLFQKP